MNLSCDLSTTAMGIMPHNDMDEALELACTLDIPFWPQLPKMSFYEDMYVQATEHFPGIVVDEGNLRIFLDTERFLEDIPEYIEHENNDEYFLLSPSYSPVYKRFLERDTSGYRAIHGQVISPVSLALKIVDENGTPIVYNDEVRSIIYSFIQHKLNVQYGQLRIKNNHAFVWIDDPGLEYVFSAMCGYDHVKAARELNSFFENIQGPRGVHLCGRPDWDFLLSLNIEILSLNAYAFGDIFATYDRVTTFLKKGGIICWGIVPTCYEEFCKESVQSLAQRIVGTWRILENKGIGMDTIVRQSLLAPATCNLMNPDKTLTVERSFKLLKELSQYLKGEYLQ